MSQATDVNTLQLVWFALIAVLFTGYFVLEGFDYGVGILLPVIGKTESERRAMITTLGPLWDGNEVWLLTAGGALFAAFPEWYATLFSGFYLPLLLILLALIGRGVALEYRSKHASLTWRRNWDYAIVIGSFLPALLWGVAFGNIVRGVTLVTQPAGNIIYGGSFFDLLNPYALLGGLTTLTLFVTHGAVFLALKTHGTIRVSANKIAGQIGIVAAVFAVVFLLWSQLSYANGTTWTWAPTLLGAGFFVGALIANRLGREGWAFLASALTLGMAVIALFGMLYPYVLPNIDRVGPALTVANASSSEYTLKIMTVVALILTPIVLMYQAWTYWVFRKRIGAEDIVDAEKGSLDEIYS